MPHATQQLTGLIRDEIRAAGPISFARFMDVALYHPIHGYYQQPSKQVGCQGDFYTSVSVGPLFGQLLAFQFAQWLEELPADAPFRLVEAGAHDGRLALDILSWLQQQRPGVLDQVEYWIIEPSAARRQSQAEMLPPFRERVRWFPGLEAVPPESISGVIFSNELLDAFPVFRAGWDAAAKAWFEWRVAWQDERFAWIRATGIISQPLQDELNNPFWRSIPPELLALLPDGFTVDLCPAAAAWWSEAAGRLRRGHLLAFDYGLIEDELLAPHRPNGTLRSYSRHRLTADPLAFPGGQDLTAHVNFSAVIHAGESAGLRTEEFRSQSSFLTAIAARAHAEPARFGPWDPRANRQLQTLVHPQHLGQSFRFLRQSRSS